MNGVGEVRGAGDGGCGYVPCSVDSPSVCRGFSVLPSDGYTGWLGVLTLFCRFSFGLSRFFGAAF